MERYLLNLKPPCVYTVTFYITTRLFTMQQQNAGTIAKDCLRILQLITTNLFYKITEVLATKIHHTTKTPEL